MDLGQPGDQSYVHVCKYIYVLLVISYCINLQGSICTAMPTAGKKRSIIERVPQTEHTERYVISAVTKSIVGSAYIKKDDRRADGSMWMLE